MIKQGLRGRVRHRTRVAAVLGSAVIVVLVTGCASDIGNGKDHPFMTDLHAAMHEQEGSYCRPSYAATLGHQLERMVGRSVPTTLDTKAIEAKDDIDNDRLREYAHCGNTRAPLILGHRNLKSPFSLPDSKTYYEEATSHDDGAAAGHYGWAQADLAQYRHECLEAKDAWKDKDTRKSEILTNINTP